MADDVSRWSEELARDPDSVVFVQLAEALRRRGEAEVARKIAVRGLARHAENPDAHDLLARISADLGDLELAGAEWMAALRLDPSHVGALKGLGFATYQQGRLADAKTYLERASAVAEDPGVRLALDAVRRRLGSTVAEPSIATPAPSTAPAGTLGAGDRSEATDDVFADLLPDSGSAAILVDGAGLVLAGTLRINDGRDVAAEVGAHLSGVSDEARRATRHLDIGGWRAIVFETDAAVVGIVPVIQPPADASAVQSSREMAAGAENAVVVLTTPRRTPLGLLRRAVQQCAQRARRWAEDAAT